MDNCCFPSSLYSVTSSLKSTSFLITELLASSSSSSSSSSLTISLLMTLFTADLVFLGLVLLSPLSSLSAPSVGPVSPSPWQFSRPSLLELHHLHLNCSRPPSSWTLPSWQLFFCSTVSFCLPQHCCH